MMKFKVELTCDNPAFGTTQAETMMEVARILANLANNMAMPYEGKTLYDNDGNKVGRATWKKER